MVRPINEAPSGPTEIRTQLQDTPNNQLQLPVSLVTPDKSPVRSNQLETNINWTLDHFSSDASSSGTQFPFTQPHSNESNSGSGLSSTSMSSFLDHAIRRINVDWSPTKPGNWPPKLVDILVEGFEQHVSAPDTAATWWPAKTWPHEAQNKTPTLEAMLQYIAHIADMPAKAAGKDASKHAHKSEDRQLMAIQIGRGLTRNVSDQKEINALICAVADLLVPKENNATKVSDEPHRLKKRDYAKSIFKPVEGMLKWGERRSGVLTGAAASAGTMVVTAAAVLTVGPVMAAASVVRDATRDVKNVNKAINWICELVEKIEKSPAGDATKMKLTQEALDACAKVVGNSERKHQQELDRRVGKAEPDAKVWQDAKDRWHGMTKAEPRMDNMDVFLAVETQRSRQT